MVEVHVLIHTIGKNANKGLQCDGTRASDAGRIKGAVWLYQTAPRFSFSISGGPQLYSEYPRSGIPLFLPSRE